MSLPLISIVLPTYNGSRYLREAIESCRAQTFAGWELIIVDDASTDETLGICREFEASDSRIRVVRHKENRKLPAALNTGFSSARGEYLTWTSDDNLFEPDALAEMIAFLRGNPVIDIVYSDYLEIDELGKLTRRVTAPSPSALVSCNAVGPSFLYRRKVHEALHGYDESLFLVEDYDFWIRASLLFRMDRLHMSLYRYRCHGASLTTLKLQEIAYSYLKVLELNLPRMEWLGAASRCAGWLNLAGISLEQGKRDLVPQYLWRAFCSSFIVTMLVTLKVLLGGRRITYRHQLHLHDLPVIAWLDRGKGLA